jgi:hypothetical protein
VKKLLLSILLAWSFALSSAELPAPLTALSDSVKEHPVTVLEFTQQQVMPLLETPLKLSGRLVVIPDKGLLWITETPFPDKQLMGLDGKIHSVFGSQDGHPLMTRLLLAVFGFDQDQLVQYFEIIQSGDEKNWTLSLVPKVSWLEAHIASVALIGGSKLDEIKISNSDGGYSRYFISAIESRDQSGAQAMIVDLLPTELLRSNRP